MDYVRRFKLLISAPGDVAAELEKIDHAIRLFNRTMGEVQGMFIDPKHWSTDSHPQSGERPQELLNEQFIRECDAVIAIFGTRFGTPTGKYDSGTEEEIEEMLKAGKPVFLYFSEIPKDPSTINVGQFDKVKAFQEKYRSHGLYGVFKTLEEIDKKVHSDLSLYFLKQPNGNAGKEKAVSMSESSFELTSAPPHPDDAKKLTLFPLDRELLKSTVTKSMMPSIDHKFKKILNLTPPPNETQPNSSSARIQQGSQVAEAIKMFNQANSILGGPVTIEEKTRARIFDFARKNLNLNLPNNFFHLDDLRENKFAETAVSFGRGPVYKGSPESQEKFSLICELDREILRFVGFEKWFQQLESISLLQPVLKNIGGHFDEDITVDFFFPPNTIENVRKLTKPEFECSELITEQLLPFLFKPQKNFDVEEYPDYPSSINADFSLPTHMRTRDAIAKDRADEYFQWLKEHFCYEVHNSGDKQVVTCKFSYLRQHTSVFIPAPLLIKNDCIEIGYRIRSKHSSKVTSGTLQMG